MSDPRDPPETGRIAIVAAGVLVLHALALWAVGLGLACSPASVLTPARMIVSLVRPAPPQPARAEAPPPAAPAPALQPPPPEPAPVAHKRPAPPPRPIRQSAPAAPLALAPTAPVVRETPPAELPDTAVATAANAPPAAPAPAAGPPTPAAPVVVLPSSEAAYLNNPPPLYPEMSRRMGETGRVIVRVLIGPNGRAREAHIDRSSGFERLDKVALETARDLWRYVPGTRDGVPEAMWYRAPIDFVLK